MLAKDSNRILIKTGFVLTTFLFFQSSYASSWSKSSWSSSQDTPAPRQIHKQEALTDLSPYSPGSNNLALDLGQVFLMGDLGKYADSIGSQLHYTYGVSELFGFDTSFGYSEHSDGKFSMVSVLTGMRMNLSWYDKIIPYAVFGLGFYKPSYQDPTAPVQINGSSTSVSSVSSVLFGVHMGPGIDLALSQNLFFGAALTFHNMFGTTKTLSNGTPLDVGGTYTSFLLHIGATF